MGLSVDEFKGPIWEDVTIIKPAPVDASTVKSLNIANYAIIFSVHMNLYRKI